MLVFWLIPYHSEQTLTELRASPVTRTLIRNEIAVAAPR